MEVGDALYALNDNDLMWFRRLVDQEVARVGNTQNRSTRDWIEDEECPAPEVYVALVPSGGIAAFSPSGSFGTLQGPVFSAQCDVFRLLNVGGSYYLSPIGATVGNNVRTVYNLSSQVISGGIYVTVERDKFGAWWITGASGAAGTSVRVLQVVGTAIDGINPTGALYDVEDISPSLNSATLGFSGPPAWLFVCSGSVMPLTPGDHYCGYANGTYSAYPHGDAGTGTGSHGSDTKQTRPLYIGWGGWLKSISASGVCVGTNIVVTVNGVTY